LQAIDHGINYEIVRGKFACGSPPPPIYQNPFSKLKKTSMHHVWIELPDYDNIIVDSTADQFGDFPQIWFPADKKCYKHKVIGTKRTYR
jgi:hypothetical protein